MAIKKTKHSDKKTAHKSSADVTSHPDIEQKRKEFQEVASGKARPTTAHAKSASKHVSKPKRLLLLLTIVVVLVGMVVAVVYTLFWNQSPQRVVLESLSNAASADSVTLTGTVGTTTATEAQKASFTSNIASSGNSVHLTVPAAAMQNNKNLEAWYISKDSNSYIKISDIDSLVTSTLPASYVSLYTPAASYVKSTLNGQWIDAGKVQAPTCTAALFQQALASTQSSQAFSRLYQASPFGTIEEQSKASDLTGEYSITINHDRFVAFMQSVAAEDSFSAGFKACAADLASTADITTSQYEFHVTIDKPSRKITQLTIQASGDAGYVLTAQIKYDVAPATTKPENAIKLNDISYDVVKTYLGDISKALKTALISVIMGA